MRRRHIQRPVVIAYIGSVVFAIELDIDGLPIFHATGGTTDGQRLFLLGFVHDIVTGQRGINGNGRSLQVYRIGVVSRGGGGVVVAVAHAYRGMDIGGAGQIASTYHLGEAELTVDVDHGGFVVCTANIQRHLVAQLGIATHRAGDGDHVAGEFTDVEDVVGGDVIHRDGGCRQGGMQDGLIRPGARGIAHSVGLGGSHGHGAAISRLGNVQGDGAVAVAGAHIGIAASDATISMHHQGGGMAAIVDHDGGTAVLGQISRIQLDRGFHLAVHQLARVDHPVRCTVFADGDCRRGRWRGVDDGGSCCRRRGTGGIGAGGNQCVGAIRQRRGGGDEPVAITAHHRTANHRTGGIGDNDGEARNAGAMNGGGSVIGSTDVVDADIDRYCGIAGGVGLYRRQIEGCTTGAITQRSTQGFTHAHQADKAVAAFVCTTGTVQAGSSRIKLGQGVLAIFQCGQHLLCFRCQLGYGSFGLVGGLRLHGFGGQRHFTRAVHIQQLTVGTRHRQGGTVQQHHTLTRLDDVAGLEDTFMPLGINRFGNAVDGNNLTLDSSGTHV